MPLKTTRRVFLPTYKIHSFQIATLKLNFQAFAAKRGNYVWWTKYVSCLICFHENKKIKLFLGQKYDHPRLQYFKLKLESSGNDSILRTETSFSWSALAYQARRVQFPSSTRNGLRGSLPVFRETIVAGCLFLAAVVGSKKVIHFFPHYPTILDKINGKLRPLLPPKSRMGKWRVFALRAASSLIWGGWGFAVPFYFVQDCNLPRRRS